VCGHIHFEVVVVIFQTLIIAGMTFLIGFWVGVFCGRGLFHD